MESGKRGKHESSSKLCSESRSGDQIYVDGEEVAVSDEVYEAYASMDRRERYLEERDNDDKPLSVDALLEEGYSEAALCSAENLEDMIADKLLVKRLNAALETLDPADREMIHAVFFDGLSMREYAKRLGVYPRAVVYRMERLLKMLRKML